MASQDAASFPLSQLLSGVLVPSDSFFSSPVVLPSDVEDLLPLNLSGGLRSSASVQQVFPVDGFDVFVRGEWPYSSVILILFPPACISLNVPFFLTLQSVLCGCFFLN